VWSSTYVCPPPFNLVEMASTRTAPLAYDWVQVRQMEKQSRFFRGLLASRGSGSKQVIPTFRCCQLAIILPRPLAAQDSQPILLLFLTPFSAHYSTDHLFCTYTRTQTHDTSIAPPQKSPARIGSLSTLDGSLRARRHRSRERVVAECVSGACKGTERSRACSWSHTSWSSGAATASNNNKQLQAWAVRHEQHCEFNSFSTINLRGIELPPRFFPGPAMTIRSFLVPSDTIAWVR